MAEDRASGRAQYRAFISYSHRDAAFAGRLHRWLERYSLPRQLGADRRLSPIFKDREELPAAADLSAQVRAALGASACLIVICSPDAAASPWVGREIETFRALHPAAPVLAALVAGEPGVAFPPALYADGAEPLAADFRKTGDGERLARLKLAAGIAGVGVDRLIQRDAQRRLQSVTALTVAALVGMLAMGLTTAFALNAKAEAERQRALAQQMVDYMQSDLRDRLKGVGRLDALGSANALVLNFYETQGLDKLTPRQRRSYALLLDAMSEDMLTGGDLGAGLAKARQAQAILDGLLARTPKDPELLFDEAQVDYRLGDAYDRLGQPDRALEAWQRYRLRAGQLVMAGGPTPRNRREVGYAEGNLCAFHTRTRPDPATAPKACRAALDIMSGLLAEQPGDRALQASVANRHAFLADALVLAGRLDEARVQRLAQERILNALLAGDPDNMTYRQRWVGAQRALATLDAMQERFPQALARLAAGRRVLLKMIAFEPANAENRQQLEKFDQTIANIEKTN